MNKVIEIIKSFCIDYNNVQLCKGYYDLAIAFDALPSDKLNN